jgi:outer membrane protein OmpA-like peptidoglycan-associated protein
LGFRAGVAGHYLDRKLTLTVDLNLPTDNVTEPSAGAEYWIADILAVRGGWRGGYASQMTLGLGFKVGLFLLDYAWQPYNELGDTQRLGASVAWGTPDAAIEALKPLLGPMGEAEWRLGGFRLLPARPDTVKHWSVTVIAPDGQASRTLQGDGPAPDTVDWDGKDDQGHVLPDLVYHARLDVVYNNGLEAKATGAPVELDSTPPDVSCTLAPIIARPNAEGAVLVPAHIAIYATDKHGIGAWKMEIRDPQGNLFKAFSGDGNPPRDLVWDGTDGLGHYVQTGSHYVFWPFAKDRLGNWGRGKPSAMLVLLKEIHFDIASDALFEPGKADVRITAYHQLGAVKELIDKYAAPGSQVDIVGHTDNVPTVYSVYKSNQELSLARAKAVIRYLVDLLDMDPNMLTAKGVGDTQPKASDATPEGRLANRRVEVVVHAKEYR